MSVENRLLQKQERVVEHRTGLALEALDQRLYGDLRGNLAVVVAAHTVGDDHQQGIA